MALNAVERRLLDLRYQWEAFAEDPVPRMLAWTVPDGAMRLVRCFLEVQKHEGEYVTQDLFIVFDAPFEHAFQYSHALKEALAGHYAASREDLEREGHGSVWNADPASFPESAYGFIQALRSLGGAYHNAIGHLVAVFAPASVSKDTLFAAWLARTLEAGLPERLRILVLDSLETPRLTEFRPADPTLLKRETLALDATAIATETFAQERTVGPAGLFRNMLMALVALVEKAPLAQVIAKGTDALTFVRAQGWKDQEAVVAMLVAGAMLKEKRFDAAVGTYRNGRAAAVSAAQEGHPAAQALVLQTWFGEAGVQLAAGRTAEAAAAYEQAAVVAQEARNTILAIEAFRMAAFCHARLDDRAAAIDRGGLALTAGERLKPEARIMTTLPLAAADLLRVLDTDRADAIETVRTRAGERYDALAASLDAHAARHERTVDPGAFRKAEDTLEQHQVSAARIAERELLAVMGAASPAFQQVFGRARGLLGREWPLWPPVSLDDPLPAGAPRELAAT